MQDKSRRPQINSSDLVKQELLEVDHDHHRQANEFRPTMKHFVIAK